MEFTTTSTASVTANYTIVSEKTNYEQRFEEVTGENFNRFYAKYYPKLVWHIQKMNINTIDAEDLANRAFMNALTKIDMYDPNYHFSTWLFTAGKNLAYKFKTDSSKIFLIDTNGGSHETNDHAYSTLQYHLVSQHDTSNLDYDNITKLKYEATLEEIQRLSPIYKTIVTMRDVEGYTYAEICEQLGIQLHTVKNRLHHGRTTIENKLKEKFSYIYENY